MVTVDRVTDEMLVGREGKLFHVNMRHKVDLSPEVKEKTGIWSADPILKGSSAINTIVKFATTLLPEAEGTKREVLDRIADQLTKKTILNIKACIDHAMWALSGPVEAYVKWKDPWEHPVEWLSFEMNVNQRLHALYNKLVRYTSLTVYDPEAATKVGASPAQQQQFETLTFDPAKVYHSITLLAKWRPGRMEPYVCALQMAARI